MFKKGESGNPTGRPQGAKDKNQSEIKEAFQSLVEGNLTNIERWLNKVAIKDPAKALDILLRLSEFILPKMKATDLTTNGKPLINEPTMIVFKDFQKENELSKQII